MSLQSWISEWKLGRVERKMKILHSKQRQVRDEMSRLDDERKKGGMPDAEYESRHTALEAKKREITERVNTLHAQEESLRKDLEPSKGAHRS